ncbi:MAG: DNA/RNA nuclease SfsA [Thermoplasmatota archaeon]
MEEVSLKKQLLNIPYTTECTFVERKNRFLGLVRISSDKNLEEVHIRDPGRLKEILYPGNQVIIKRVENDHRKTSWDLIAGLVNDNWVLVNSGYHRRITERILEDRDINPFGEIDNYQAEIMIGDSRIDFLLKKEETNIWVEVKGCTLSKNRMALFPDAPTTRGRRHMEELSKAHKKGDKSAVIFLVFRPDSKCFSPNDATDPEFSNAFWKAIEEGIDVYPLVFKYENGGLFYIKKIPLCEQFDS